MKKLLLIIFATCILSACATPGSKIPATPTPEYRENEEGSKMYDIRSYTHPDIPGYLIVDQAEDGNTLITIDVVSGDTTEIQPIAIYQGSCNDEKLGNVLYPLNELGDGMSETTLPISVDTFLGKENLKVVVKKSKNESEIVTACGDL